jgi:hypothetical protein
MLGVVIFILRATADFWSIIYNQIMLINLFFQYHCIIPCWPGNLREGKLFSFVLSIWCAARHPFPKNLLSLSHEATLSPTTSYQIYTNWPRTHWVLIGRTRADISDLKILTWALIPPGKNKIELAKARLVNKENWTFKSYWIKKAEKCIPLQGSKQGLKQSIRGT